MKHIRAIQLIGFSMFFLNSPIQSEINQSPQHAQSADEQAQIAEIVAFAKDAVSDAFSVLRKIEQELTIIAILAQKGGFGKKAHPTTIMRTLTENKMTVEELLRSQTAVAAIQDPIQHLEIAFVISEFCSAFITYFNKQLLNNFAKVKPFNFNRFLQHLQRNKTRSNMAHLEPASLIYALGKTHAKLENLEITVKNVGLTWYNKAARTVDRYVVTPANKWYVPQIAAYGAGIGLFSLYTLWSYGWTFKDNENSPKWLTDFIKKLYSNRMGPMVRDNKTGKWEIMEADSDVSSKTISYGHKGDEGDFPTDASMLAGIDYTIKDFMLNGQPLGALVAGFMATSFYKTWKEDIYPAIIKKRDGAWNFLRGGEYLNSYTPGLVMMKPTVSFKDMVGLKEVVESLSQIVQYVNDPEQLQRIGATPEKGWLLTGAPRTGKTFSVECLCGEIELAMQRQGLSNTIKFFNINATLINEFGIKMILDEVAANAPAVIFIDEIDLLGLERTSNNKLLSDFLTSMQSSMNADPNKIVIVIAATNKPENIDSALRQSGRFGKEIRFDYPSRKYRIEYIIRELSGMALEIKNFDVEKLADKTHNKTFEDLKRVIRSAMTRSWMNGVTLTQQLLEESVDTELHNVIMFNRKDLPEKEMRIVATHFAGRGIVSLLLETHDLLDKITTYAHMTDIEDVSIMRAVFQKQQNARPKKDKIEYGMIITKQPYDTIDMQSEELILNNVTILLAGFAAEELLLGSCGFKCHSHDHEKAYRIITELVFGGLDPKELPKDVCQELKLKAFALLKQCTQNAIKLLSEHKDALIAVTEELIKKQILNDKEIKAIINKVENKTPEVVASNDAALTEEENAALDDIFDEMMDEMMQENDDEVQIDDSIESFDPVEATDESEFVEDEIEATGVATEHAEAIKQSTAAAALKEKAAQLLRNGKEKLSDMIANGSAKVVVYTAAAKNRAQTAKQTFIDVTAEPAAKALILLANAHNNAQSFLQNSKATVSNTVKNGYVKTSVYLNAAKELILNSISASEDTSTEPIEQNSEVITVEETAEIQ